MINNDYSNSTPNFPNDPLKERAQPSGSRSFKDVQNQPKDLPPPRDGYYWQRTIVDGRVVDVEVPNGYTLNPDGTLSKDSIMPPADRDIKGK